MLPAMTEFTAFYQVVTEGDPACLEAPSAVSCLTCCICLQSGIPDDLSLSSPQSLSWLTVLGTLVSGLPRHPARFLLVLVKRETVNHGERSTRLGLLEAQTSPCRVGLGTTLVCPGVGSLPPC